MNYSDDPPMPSLGSALEDHAEDLESDPRAGMEDGDLPWYQRSDDGLVAWLKDFERDYFDYALNHGFVDMWLSMLAEYYGKDPTTFSGFDASQIEFEGDDAELVRFRVNELRSYVRQAVTRTTRERPAFKAGTLNTNFSAGAQVELLDALSNHLYERYMGEKRERRLVERQELFGKTHVWGRWDESLGDMFETPEVLPAGTVIDGTVIEQDAPTGLMVQERTGEPVLRIKMPWDVIEDPTVDDDDDHCVRMVRERRSKTEIMGRYMQDQDTVEKIKAYSIGTEVAYELSLAFDDQLPTDDDVLLKHVYYPPDGAYPEGMYAVLLGDHVLERVPWSQAPVHSATEMPVVPYDPSEMVGTSFRYSEGWDQLVIQQMVTQLTSDCATNLSAFGRQFIMLPQGSDITPEQLANGMFAAYVPEDQVGKVAAPQLAQIGSGAQWFIGWLQKVMQTLRGENSVTRGDPSENIKSGTMAALFHAIALEHGHIPQATLDDVRGKVCMMLVDFMRRYGKGEFIARIVGEDEEPQLQYFKRDVLEPIRETFVKTTNPMLRARAGKVELANFLKSVGAIQTPQQALQAFTTGQIKPLYRGPESNLSRIQLENQMLRKGPAVEAKLVPVIDQMTGLPAIDPMTGMPQTRTERRVPEVPVDIGDNPYQHINEHYVVKNDPSTSPEGRAAVDAHIAEHLRVYRLVPPELAAIRGFPPIMAAAPMPEITEPGGGRLKPPGLPKSGPEANDVDETGINLPKAAETPTGAMTQT